MKWDSRHAASTVRKYLPLSPCWRDIVFVVGCGRSGTTLLGELLGGHRNVHYLNEPRDRWAALSEVTDDIDLFGTGRGRMFFSAGDAMPEHVTRFERLFGVRDPGAARTLVEKLPQNCFRIPWLRRLASQAKFLHIVRDWPDVVASIARLSLDDSYTIAGRPLLNRWWGSRYAKLDRFIEELAGSNLIPIRSADLCSIPTTEADYAKLAACEWYASIQAVHAARDLLGADFLEIRYEDLVANPRGVLSCVYDFLELRRDGGDLDRAIREVKTGPHAAAAPASVAGALRDACESLRIELGYDPRPALPSAPVNDKLRAGSSPARSSERIAVLFERFGPYHHARVRAAAAAMPVHAIEIFRQDDTYAWDVLPEQGDYPKETLFPHPTGSAGQRHDALWRALDRAAPAVIAVPGWAYWYSHASLGWARKHGAKMIVMSETTRADRDRAAARELTKRAILAGFDAALVGGTPQWRYMVELGFPPERIELGYDAVDNDYFIRGSDEARRDGAATRERFDLPPRFLLTSCRLIRRKNVGGLLRAFAVYRGRTGDAACDLVVMGDGPEKASLVALAEQLGITPHVRFMGFRQYPDLPAIYAMATAFILPSLTEPWGLVVNEAMACGIPVLASDTAGCARDFVVPGETGWRFHPTDTARLAELLSAVSADSRLTARMGEAARRFIRDWGPDRFARGLAAARETALGSPSMDLSLGARLVLRAAALR